MIDIHFRDDDDGPAATVASEEEARDQIAEWVKGDSDVSIDDILLALVTTVTSGGETFVTMPETPDHESVVWVLRDQSDAAYLLDLSKRLRGVPIMYGTDGYDIDHLREIANRLRDMMIPDVTISATDDLSLTALAAAKAAFAAMRGEV